MASEVIVAPETASTAILWWVTISAGMEAMASSEMLGDSECSVTVTSVMAESPKVTETVREPFLPCAEAVYSPAVKREACGADSVGAADVPGEEQ